MFRRKRLDVLSSTGGISKQKAMKGNYLKVSNSNGKGTWKATKLKFWCRFFAVIDVLFARKFELTVWNKQGRKKVQTKFCQQEIENAFYSDVEDTIAEEARRKELLKDSEQINEAIKNSITTHFLTV